MHSGGAASEGADEEFAAALGAGVAPVGRAEPLPVVPEPATPPLPLQEVVSSGTQVNPDPQDASVEHGTRYRGTQPVTVVVVHGSGVDGTHFVPGAQSTAVSVGQTCCVSDTHTMPLAQSAFAVQGSGTHSLTSVGVHGGQVCPGAHAIAGHDEVPVTWQP